MGTAFAGVADDPSAMAYNPAGLTQLTGTEIYGGAAPILPSTTLRDVSGREASTSRRLFVAPNVYVVSDVGTADLRLGLAAFSPFGIGGRRWDRRGVTRYISTESAIATVCVNPTIAYRIVPALSLGAGMDYVQSWTTARRMVDQSAFGSADGEMSVDGSGGGWGYNVGLLFAPTAELSIGAAYRSGVAVRHEGEARLTGIAVPLQPAFGGAGYTTTAFMPASFPQVITFGAAWRVAPYLTLAADAEDIRWSSFRTADLELAREVPQAGFTHVSVPLRWRDSWSFKVGAEYGLRPGFSLRAGYAYVRSPVPDATLDPSNPDANLHGPSAGLGYRASRLVIDVFYMPAFYERRTVRNPVLSGTYSNFVHFTGLSVGYRFDTK